MPQCDNAWLRYQQQRWMRPDAMRYLRSDAARFLKPGADPADVYPALHRLQQKGRSNQPRVPSGNRFGGRWTSDGNGGGPSESGNSASSSTSDGTEGNPQQLDEIVVGTGSELSSGSDFWSGLWSGLGSLFDNIDDIQSSPTDTPPNIPNERPSRSSQRIGVVRAISNWLARNSGLVADIYFGFQSHIDWLEDYQDVIQANRDPPRSLQELMSDVGKRRSGYDDHHIIEQTAAERWGLTRSEIDDPSNLVSVPRLKHYQITGWYATANDDFGGLSPREYLSSKPPDERRAVGLQALRLFEVPKP